MSGYQCPHCHKGMSSKQLLVKHLKRKELTGHCPTGWGGDNSMLPQGHRFLDDAKAAGLCDGRARVNKRTRRLSVEIDTQWT